MADEIKTTMAYEVKLDSTQVALGLGQLTQGVDSKLGLMIGAAGAALKGGLMEPIQTALGMPPMGAAGGRMMLSQSMAAGWQNLETAAREYTHMGFYQNMLFGTQPESGQAGLRNRLMMQQAMGAAPIGAGGVPTGEMMRNMADQVMQPYGGYLGVQKPAGQMMASAMQAGLFDYAGSANQRMQAFQQAFSLQGFNRVYQVGGQEGGQLLAAVASTGMPAGQYGAAYMEAVRAQVSGVPLGASLNAMAQTERMTAFQQAAGILGPSGNTPRASNDLGMIEMGIQSMKDRGNAVTDADRASMYSTYTHLNTIRGKTDQDRIDNAEQVFRMVGGQRAAHLDRDMIAGMDAQRKLAIDQNEATSAMYSRNRLSFERAMDPRALLRDAIGIGAGMLPTEAENSVKNFIGYTSFGQQTAASSYLSAGPGGKGGFSKTALGLYSTLGGSAMSTQNLAKVQAARHAADSATGVDRLKIMSEFAANEPAAQAYLEKSYEAFRQSGQSAVGGMADFFKKNPTWGMVAAGVGGLDLAGSVAASVDAEKFYAATAPGFWKGAEAGMTRAGGGSGAIDAAYADAYGRAGLSADKKSAGANESYLAAISRMASGDATPDQAWSELKGSLGKGAAAYQSKFAEAYASYSGAATDPEGRKRFSGPGAASLEASQHYRALKEVGAVGPAFPAAMRGLDAALGNRIEITKDEVAKKELQSYRTEVSGAAKLTSSMDQAQALNQIATRATQSGTEASKMFLKNLDQQFAIAAQGTGSSNAPAMELSGALIRAADAMSVVGHLFKAFNSKGRPQGDGSKP